MVRIRLMRIGQKKQPVYRLVITDRRNARDSRYIEAIGHYNPRTQPHTIEVNEERALYWLSVGAQPSESVAQLLTQTGTMDRYARMRGGEAVEALVAEAVTEKDAADDVSPRTAYPAPSKAESSGPVAQLVDDVKDTVSNAVDAVQDAVEDVVETVTGEAEEAVEDVADEIDDAAEDASEETVEEA